MPRIPLSSVFKRIRIPIVSRETNVIYVTIWNAIFPSVSVPAKRKMRGLSGKHMKEAGYRSHSMMRKF